MRLSVRGLSLSAGILLAAVVFVVTLARLCVGGGGHMGLLAAMYPGYNVGTPAASSAWHTISPAEPSSAPCSPGSTTSSASKHSRSVALPRQFVDEVLSLASPDAAGNLNRRVAQSLRESVARRKALALETAMARMAADPAIRQECAAIAAPCWSSRWTQSTASRWSSPSWWGRMPPTSLVTTPRTSA